MSRDPQSDIDLLRERLSQDMDNVVIQLSVINDRLRDLNEILTKASV